MMLRDTIKKVEASEEFKALIKEDPHCYLAHAFTMVDEKEKKYRWEMGYYSEKKDLLTVFETEPKILRRDDEEAFRKEGDPKIRKLDMHDVKISLASAMDICEQLVRDKYPGHGITQRIIVLQSLDRPIYNITLVTRSFSVLNLKIDAGTGEVLSHNLQSIMSLGKAEKGERKD